MFNLKTEPITTIPDKRNHSMLIEMRYSRRLMEREYKIMRDERILQVIRTLDTIIETYESNKIVAKRSGAYASESQLALI